MAVLIHKLYRDGDGREVHCTEVEGHFTLRKEPMQDFEGFDWLDMGVSNNQV